MTDIELKFIVAGCLLVLLMLAKFLSGGRPYDRRSRRVRQPQSDLARTAGEDMPRYDSAKDASDDALAPRMKETAKDAGQLSEVERAFFEESGPDR